MRKARTFRVDFHAGRSRWFWDLVVCNKSCGWPTKFVMVRSRCFSYFYPLSSFPIRLPYLIKFLLLHVLPTIPSECFKRQRLNWIEWAGNVEAVCVRNLKWWISMSNMSYDAERANRPPFAHRKSCLFCVRHLMWQPKNSAQDLNLIQIPEMSLETNISCLNIHIKICQGIPHIQAYA